MASRPGQQGLQEAGFRGGWRPGPRVDQGAITGEHEAVHAIGFGAHRQSPAKVPGLGGIDDGNCDAGIAQGQRGGFVINAGTLQNGVQLGWRDAVLGRPGQQIGNAGFGVGNRLRFAFAAGRIEEQAAIEFSFGNINADEKHRAKSV